MTTREEAIAAAGRSLAAGLRHLETATVDEVVEAAYTPTGPPREELRRQVIAMRSPEQKAAS